MIVPHVRKCCREHGMRNLVLHNQMVTYIYEKQHALKYGQYRYQIDLIKCLLLSTNRKKYILSFIAKANDKCLLLLLHTYILRFCIYGARFIRVVVLVQPTEQKRKKNIIFRRMVTQCKIGLSLHIVYAVQQGKATLDQHGTKTILSFYYVHLHMVKMICI